MLVRGESWVPAVICADQSEAVISVYIRYNFYNVDFPNVLLGDLQTDTLER